MARPRIEIDQSSIERTIDGVVQETLIATREEAEEIGKAMVQEVQEICAALFENDNRKINTTHLVNSFTYVVEYDNDAIGWNVSLTIKPGVSSGKIWALNYGRSGESRTYVIRPRNTPRALEFKGTGTDYSYAKNKGAYAGRVLRPYAVRQTAGASQGYFFMEEARDNVLRRFGYGHLV